MTDNEKKSDAACRSFVGYGFVGNQVLVARSGSVYLYVRLNEKWERRWTVFEMVDNDLRASSDQPMKVIPYDGPDSFFVRGKDITTKKVMERIAKMNQTVRSGCDLFKKKIVEFFELYPDLEATA